MLGSTPPGGNNGRAAQAAAAAARVAAAGSRAVEVLLELQPAAFALAAGSFDAVERLSGAALRVVDRGPLPLGLCIAGRQEQVEVARELVASLTRC